jgi:hypothetical protein
MFNKQKLIINARGLEGGLRAKADGVVFFGTDLKDKEV